MSAPSIIPERLDKQGVLDAVRRGHDTVPAIAAIVGLRNPQISTLLNRLRREGKVEVAGRVYLNKTIMMRWKAAQGGGNPEAAERTTRPARIHARPVSLTAAVFGDPLPGRSALEKRVRADQ